MDTLKLRFPWFGVALIAVGVTMLLHRLGVLHVSWHVALWGALAIVGAYKLVTAFSMDRPGSAFWGLVFLVVGGYGVLEELDLFYVSSYYLFPWTVILVGAGFLMMFLVRPRSWHVIVPALFFLGAGTMMLLAEMGYFDQWDVLEGLRMYWPIALILFGITLLLNRKTGQ